MTPGVIRLTQAGPRPPIATGQQIVERIAWSRRELRHTVIHREAFDRALR